jgi:heme exporter protein A
MRLRVEGVRCLLGRREALAGVDLDVGPGEVVALLGPNGAGKTTLLRVLAGLLRPTDGRVLWDGRPPATRERRRIGYAGHGSLLYENLTARENLLFYGRLYGVPDAEERARGLLAEEGLTLFTHEPVRRFSRGMQQRLALCRAWLHAPETLLLDEPWTGLDRDATARWERRLAALRAGGGSAVVVLHDHDAAGRLADRLVHLKGGRLIAAAEPSRAPAGRRGTRAADG